MTADEYTSAHDRFLTFSLQLTQITSFIARNTHMITQCMQKYCFADKTKNVEEYKTEMRKIIRNLRSNETTSFVQSICSGCRCDYADDLCRKPTAHKQCSYKREPNTTQKGATQWSIQKHMKTAMDQLAKQISTLDYRYTCEVVAVGSAYEGTKIGCCDEFDFNFVLNCLSRMCRVDYSPETLPGFVLLKASTPEFDEDLFNSNGTLNTRIVKCRFEMIVKQILSSFSFCENTGLEFIDPVYYERHIPDGTVSNKLHTYIKLAFTQPLNGYHVLHDVSVDIVPALQINDWWQTAHDDDARRRDLSQTGECLIVFTQPQNKYPWIGWTEPHGFISFARAESRLLHNHPPVVKAAYMVVKRMSKYFCPCEFFSSYVIKTALLWCLDEVGFSNCSSSGDSDEINGDELLSLVQKIFRRLLSFAAQDYCPSYFMPKCHQPVWIAERYLKQFHVRLYQHGLTYKALFSLNEQQSEDAWLQHIKSMFIFSHVMYWTVLSDNDELELFVPSTINPLAEISYD